MYYGNPEVPYLPLPIVHPSLLSLSTPRRKRLKMCKSKGQFLANLIVELSTIDDEITASLIRLSSDENACAQGHHIAYLVLSHLSDEVRRKAAEIVLAGAMTRDDLPTDFIDPLMERVKKNTETFSSIFDLIQEGMIELEPAFEWEDVFPGG